VRTLDYASNETAWRHELEVNPKNPHALAGLGAALAARGDIDEAFALVRQALSPDALRYRLLANPTRYYLGLLQVKKTHRSQNPVCSVKIFRICSVKPPV
jgi:hypothetical protein